MSVTVNWTKAVAIVHAQRQRLFNIKTRDHFRQLSDNHARLEYMSAGADKTALENASTAIHDAIVVCQTADTTLETAIDAVTTDDLVALEAKLVEILNEIKTYGG